jgi:hypothetical protein
VHAPHVFEIERAGRAATGAEDSSNRAAANTVKAVLPVPGLKTVLPTLDAARFGPEAV